MVECLPILVGQSLQNLPHAPIWMLLSNFGNAVSMIVKVLDFTNFIEDFEAECSIAMCVIRGGVPTFGTDERCERPLELSSSQLVVLFLLD